EKADPQLLAHLTDEGATLGLAGLGLAAGKFPKAREVRALGPPRDQDPPLALDHRGDHGDGLAARRRHGSNSRARWRMSGGTASPSARAALRFTTRYPSEPRERRPPAAVKARWVDAAGKAFAVAKAASRARPSSPSPADTRIRNAARWPSPSTRAASSPSTPASA